MQVSKVIAHVFLISILSFLCFAEEMKLRPDVNELSKMVSDILTIDSRLKTACADCATSVNEKLPGLPKSFFALGADCRAFIKDDGEYGELGKIIENYIINEDRGKTMLRDSLVSEPNEFKRICPKWTSLTDKEKIHFWVWTMTAIAWTESKCVAKSKNLDGSYSVAVGLFQLNETIEWRDWRGKYCQVKSVYPAKNNVECAMDTMSDLMLGDEGTYKKNKGILYGKETRSPDVGSYWQHLNYANGGLIGKRIRELPFCR